MWRRPWLLLALAVLGACSKPAPPADTVDHPALWRIEKDGRHGWLFGSIHALPKGARWDSPEFSAAISESDRLVVEVIGLQEQSKVFADFKALAMTPGLPPLSARMPAGTRAELAAVLKRIGADEPSLSIYESWGAATVIANSLTGDLSEDGVEPWLMRRFAKARKPIDGMETTRQQFAYLDAMPPAAQDRYLAAVVHDPDGDIKDLQESYRAWRRGDLATIDRLTRTELNATPELAEALLVQRNRNWAAKMDVVMRAPGTPFIAVGVAHLTGPDNLIDQLMARGYTITRSE